MNAEYRLYVVRAQDIPPTERHYLITPDYALLYTQNDPPEKNEDFTSKINLLPPVALEWLIDRMNLIRAEYLEEHKEELINRAYDFLERFTEELEKEKQALNNAEAGEEA